VVVVRLYLLLFIIAGIQSCTSKDSCNNPFKIFEISESTPILQIENGASIEQIIASFEETFLEADEDDLCYQEYIFGWQLSDQIIKTHFTLYCPMKTSRRPPARAVEILLNQQGKVLLNKEIFLEIDSIDNWLLNDFSIIDEEEIFTKEISIIWRDDVPLKYYEAAILEMVNGYQLRFNKISKKQLLIFLTSSTLFSQDLPWVKVQGNQFITEEREVIIFKGLDASDPNKLEKDGHWDQEYFRQIKSWDANMVRFPIHPRAWRERGKEAYLELLDRGIEMARKEGLYVILDWHSIGNLRSEIYQHPRYDTTKKETFKFWIEMAQRYGNNSNVAMFELFNEPTLWSGKFGTCTWNQWKEIIEELIIIVRANGAKNIPIVAGFNWAYDLTEVMENPINAEGIAYVSHPYPQKREQPWESKWEADFGHVADKYPVILTEIGYCGEEDKGAHIPVISDASYVKAITDYAAKKGISYCVWVFDPKWSPMLLKDWDYNLTEPGKVWKAAMKK